MFLFSDIYSRISLKFPKFKIAFKDESLFMKILGKLLFFNPKFMTKYHTTIGHTIYFTNRKYLIDDPKGATIILLHELLHIIDHEKIGILFNLLYLFPQILSLLSIPIFLLFGWKFAILFFIFLLPIPAYFRMTFERRAYTVSLYVINKLNKMGFTSIDVNAEIQLFISQFKGSMYYFMWPFSNIETYFQSANKEMSIGNKPILEKEIYDLLDEALD